MSQKSFFLFKYKYFAAFFLLIFLALGTPLRAQRKAAQIESSALKTPLLNEVEKSYVFNVATTEELNARFLNLVQSQHKILTSSETLFYDPTLATIAAGLESRDYAKGSQFIPLELAITEKNSYYQASVPAYFEDNQSDLLIIGFGSTFSTFKRGTWFNKTYSLISDQIPQKPSFLFFPGQLTVEALASKPLKPDPTGELMARDIYERLKVFISKKSEIKEIAILGFSGGASLVVYMLALDSKSKSPLFTKGGIAFSPVLDSRLAFKILDDQRKLVLQEKIIGENEAMTTSGFIAKEITSNSLSRLFSKAEPDYVKPLKLCQDPLQKEALEWKHRFFNEFTVVDLKTVCEQTQFGSSVTDDDRNHQSLNYCEYYILNAIENDSPKLNLKITFSEIKKPLYLIFTKDDQVLANPNFDFDKAVSPNIEAIIKEAKSNKNIHVFFPSFGGHMAYFLDTKYLAELFKTFLN
jgi:hypothetical protein